MDPKEPLPLSNDARAYWAKRSASRQGPRPVQHTVNGKPIGREGVPYGTTHDHDCPACLASGASYLGSPRSETYWAS